MVSLRSDRTRLKQVLLYTILFSLAAHAYIYFTFAPSHDSMVYMLTRDEEISVQVANGRFMQPVYWLLRGRIPAPWLVGLLSVLFLTGSNYILASVLNIRGPVCTALLCGILTTNLAVTATNATYLYSVDTYMLALLLASGGVWLWERYPKWGCWAAIPLFICSMGLYQAYIDVAIGMALILLAKRAADGEPFPALWRRALRYGVSLLAGAALYFVLIKLIQSLSGVSLDTGRTNSLNNLLTRDPLSLFRLIPDAYLGLFWFFMGDRGYDPPLLRVCFAALGLAGAWQWIALLRERRIRGRELAFLLLCAALLPLGLNLIRILSPEWVHQLMQYSYYLLFVAALLPFTMTDRPGKRSYRACRTAVACVCAFVLFRNIAYANGAYFKKQLLYEASSQYGFSIIQQIESDPGYETGVTPVALIGEFAGSPMAWDEDGLFAPFSDMTGMWGGSSFSYPETFSSYSRTVFGHPIELVSDAGQLEAIAAKEAVQAMPVFPKEGSCQMVDGVMVVKLQ